ncbi:unnamed protein product, partial [Fusarium graminearum]
ASLWESLTFPTELFSTQLVPASKVTNLRLNAITILETPTENTHPSHWVESMTRIWVNWSSWLQLFQELELPLTLSILSPARTARTGRKNSFSSSLAKAFFLLQQSMYWPMLLLS